MSENKTIIIDLDDSSNAKGFDKKNILHYKSYDKVREFLDEFSKQKRSEKNDCTPKKSDLTYKHNTITILGTRGSGKTSFLLSVKDLIETDNRYKDLLVLDMVDPTLVEEKGHVFLNVISIICEEVNERLKQNESSPRNNLCGKGESWKNQMRKLAKGLPSIDGIGDNKFGEWQDAEFVMQNELMAIESARNLAKNFSLFIDYSLEILEKKYFVLFFDDIDVDSSKGHAVMETIRKYFVSDQLITFLSGDLKLYNTLVRDRKWQSFGEKIITYETSKHFQEDSIRKANMKHYNDIVTDLTSQYLIKIMQPKYRIHLFTMFEYYSRDRERIHIKVSNDESISIKKYLDAIFIRFGIHSDFQKTSFIEFLLQQSLRTVLHFLQYFKVDDKKHQFEYTDLISVFLSDLYEKNIDVGLLQSSQTHSISIILKVLMQEKMLKDSYQLVPNTLDNSLNASLFVFSLLTSDSISKGKTFLVFEYFIKIAYLRNFFEKNSSNKEIHEIIKFVGLYNERVLRDTSNQLQAALFGLIDNKGNSSEFGLIPLYALAKKAKKSSFESTYRIDYVFKEERLINRIFGYMPCFIGQYSKKRSTEMFYSIISLLSTIGELCKRYDNKSLTSDNISSTLIELSQIRNYSIYENSTNRTNSGISEDGPSHFAEVVSDDSGYMELGLFGDSLFCWLEKQVIAPPYLLGKIFTRFYSSLNKIGNEEFTNLGKFFNLQILAFFNSVLIEETRDKNFNNLNLNYDNLNKSDSGFLNNFKKSKDVLADLELTTWFMSCPIFHVYLDFSYSESIAGELHKLNDRDCLFITYFGGNSIYDILSNVLLDGSASDENISKVSSEASMENRYAKNYLAIIFKDNFIKRYKRKIYQKPTIDKFFLEYEKYFLDKLDDEHKKEFIKYCVERYESESSLK